MSWKVRFSKLQYRLETHANNFLTNSTFFYIQVATATPGTSEDESSYSSFYSSFLKTDEATSSNEGRGENYKCGSSKNSDEMQWGKMPKLPTRRPNPHWLDSVDLTNDLVYQYQVNAKTLNDVLLADLYALKKFHQVESNKLNNLSSFTNKIQSQPNMVNDQLSQLYLDLELEGLSARLSLESNSSSSGEEETSIKSTRKKRFQHSQLVLIYEENCPLPSNWSYVWT